MTTRNADVLTDQPRERAGDTLRFGPVRLAPGGQLLYRLVLDSELLGTFPVVEEVTGIGVPGAARTRPQ